MKQALLLIAVFLNIHLDSNAQVPDVTPGDSSYGLAKVPLTNQFPLYGTNLLPAQIGPLLASLQDNLEQLLPLVATFNNNFDFATFLQQFQTNTPAGPTSDLSTNLSSLTTTNLATSLADNFSTNIAVPTPPVKIGDLPGSNPQALTPPDPTGVPNSLGLPPGFIAAMPTNYPVIVAAARDSLRKLIVLQGEMERMLPLVADLNATGINVAPIINGPANVVPPAINPAPPPPIQFQPPILSPTGR